MTSIIVQPLQQTDRASWESLYHGYAKFYHVPMDQTILDQVWTWIFDEQTAFYALLAKNHSGQGLGLMHYRAMPSPLRGKTVGFLDDLYVSPAHRGTGVVEALYEALTTDAQAKGWPFIRWITAEDNDRARRLYDKISDKTHWITYQKSVC